MLPRYALFAAGTRWNASQSSREKSRTAPPHTTQYAAFGESKYWTYTRHRGQYLRSW